MNDSAKDSIGSYRFIIHRQLLSGDPWNLYEAHDRERDALVALKVFPFTRHSDIARVQSEFLALTTFIDYVRRPSRTGRAHSVLDEGRLRSALRQLAQAVDFLHQKGFVHGGLNPSNVLVTREARVVIIDFGLMVREGSQQDIGMRGYKSPEQELQASVSTASDWYSVGVMLYEALTGQRPTSDDLLEFTGRQLRPPSEVAPDIPKDLNDLCIHLLLLDRQKRPTGPQVLGLLDQRDETRLEAQIRELPPDCRAFLQDWVTSMLEKGNEKSNRKLRQTWAGALSDYRGKFTSLDLQRKALDWRGD